MIDTNNFPRGLPAGSRGAFEVTVKAFAIEAVITPWHLRIEWDGNATAQENHVAISIVGDSPQQTTDRWCRLCLWANSFSS
jgi:hypothetical protein